MISNKIQKNGLKSKMYAEDIIEHAVEGLHLKPENWYFLNEWQKEFLKSLYSQIVERQKAMSTRQAEVLIKLIKQNKEYFIFLGIDEKIMNVFLGFPKYKNPPYESIIVKREVRHIAGNVFGFRTKYDPVIYAKFNTLKEDFPEIYLHKEYKIWVVPITQENINTIMVMINDFKFSVDDNFQRWVDIAEKNKNNSSNFNAKENIVSGSIYNNEILAKWVLTNLDGILI